MHRARSELELVEAILEILADGQFVTSYKFAVLLGLIDLVAEWDPSWEHHPPVFTTRQLAERVLEIYWPQTAAWDEHVLIQGSSGGKREFGGTALTRRILETRADLGWTRRSVPVALDKHIDGVWTSLVEEIEWILIEMPLARLQRVGGTHRRILYDLGFGIGDEKPSKREMRKVSRGDAGDFDNAIRLLPGVARTLLRLGPLLRPLIEARWIEHVAKLNNLQESNLQAWLFGASRTDLSRVRKPLKKLQSGRCFYCGERLHSRVDVDHFIPWSRVPNNALANLVAAHPSCNGDKSDHLASLRHVDAWRARAEIDRGALEEIAGETAWPMDADRSVKLARGVYVTLTDDARLWDGKNAWVEHERAAILAAL